MKATKAQLSKVSRQLVNKSQSWGQVAKQLSGMKGKIMLSKTESISIRQAFIMLGVHTKSNKYTAQDLNLAWSEKLKEGKTMHKATSFAVDDWRCPLLSKVVTITANIDDTEYKLYSLVGGQYVAYKKHVLCRVVKAEDKQPNNNNIIVSAKVVLQGLVQSIFVNDTLTEIENDAKVEKAIKTAYINTGNTKAPVWEQIWKVGEKWTKEQPQVTVIKSRKRNKKTA